MEEDTSGFKKVEPQTPGTVVTKTSTESTETSPAPAESTLGNQSVRGTCALMAVATLGAGLIMLLMATVLGTLKIDASSMALVTALVTSLSMIVAQYFGQGQKQKTP